MKTPPEPKQVLKNSKPSWLVDLRCVGGGRLYFPDVEAAKRARAGAIRDQAQYGKLAFELSHEERVRWLSIQRTLAENGTTMEEVVRYWMKSNRPSSVKLLGEAIQECVQAKTNAGGRPRALRQFGYSLASFVGAIGAEVPVADVTLEQVEKWLANEKWALRTKQGRLIDLRTFYSFAAKRGWAKVDPSQAVEPYKFDEPPIRCLTVPQVKRLLTATREHEPDFLPFIVLGLFCGVRPEEIKQLSWSHINLETGYVEIPAAIAKRVKNGGSRQRRLIQLQPNALAWLKLGGTLPPEGWQDRWDRVRLAAGFRVSIKKSGKRKHTKKGEPWPKNAMRHSFCSYTLPVFGELKESEWAGHSPQVAISRYRALVTLEEAKKFWAIMPPAY